jgi:hypothetical protein
LVPKQRNCSWPFIGFGDSLYGFPVRTALRMEQRLRSYLKSAQPARCRHCPSAWSSGIGAPIFHCRLCGPDSRDLPGTPWCHRGGCPSPGMGAGLLEAATVFCETTAGVACRPKLCAALRLKTFEAWPDARCGPVRGKASSRGLVPLSSAP